MTKLLENTFRHVNIALVNELAVYASDLGIDVWAAIGRRRHQAIRISFVQARSGCRWTLPADRPELPVLAGPALARTDLPVRRARERRERAHAGLRRQAIGRRAEPGAQAAQRAAGCWCWGSPTSGTPGTPVRARVGRSCSCSAAPVPSSGWPTPTSEDWDCSRTSSRTGRRLLWSTLDCRGRCGRRRRSRDGPRCLRSRPGGRPWPATVLDTRGRISGPNVERL